MKRLLSLMLAIAVVLTSVAAFAEPLATKHEVQNNVYVEGTVGGYVAGGKLRLTITDGEDVVYVGEYADAVKGDGSYAIKFKHTGDLSNAEINVKYAAEDVTSSTVEATATTAVLEAEVMVTDSSDRAFDSDVDQSIPSHTFAEDTTTNSALGETYTLNEHTYQSDYEVPEREGLKAVVNLKNKYAYETEFTLMVAAYDENKKLLDCKIDTIEAAYGENGEAIVYDSAVINVPEGTKYAKAFCWSAANLIPYGKEADGELPVVDIFCVGDSTGDTWLRRWYPQAGWGTYLQDYLNADYAKVYYGENGKTYCTSGAWAQSILNNPDDSLYGSGSFWGANNWGKMEANERYSEGDYVIVCLGINDQSKQDADGKYTSLQWYEMGIEEMIKRTKASKTNIIICSAMPNGSTTLHSGRATFNAAAKAIADKYGVPYLDFSEKMMEVYSEFETASEVLQNYYLDRDTLMADPESNPLGFGLTADEIANHGNESIRGILNTQDGNYYYTKSDGTRSITDGDDSTHPNIRGANLACQKIVECLKESDSPLRFYVK